MAQNHELEPHLISANSTTCNIHHHMDEASWTAIITHGVFPLHFPAKHNQTLWNTHYISLVSYDKVLEMKKQTVPQFSVEIYEWY